MTDSALVSPEILGSIPVKTEIFTLVSPLGKDKILPRISLPTETLSRKIHRTEPTLKLTNKPHMLVAIK